MTRRRVYACILGVLTVVLAVAPFGSRATGLEVRDDSNYAHVWREEILLVGDAGETRKTVALSDVELSAVDGAYFGTIRYQDVLGMVDAAGAVTSRVSDIDLRLEGGSFEDELSAGGTFYGTVTFIMRTAQDLEQASAPEMMALSSGTSVTYEVEGHWGVRLDGVHATGEVIFERILSDDPSDTGSATRFNRVSLADLEGVGLGQVFETDVAGLSDPDAEASDEESGGAEAVSVQRRAPFWEYIVRGLTGRVEGSRFVVPEECDASARALRNSRPALATELPDGAVAIDLDVSGLYLDAKNRAAGLVGGTGPRVDGSASACEAFAAAREAVPGRAAIPVDEDAGLVYVERIRETIGSLPGVRGISDVAGAISLVRPGAEAPVVTRLRVLSMVVEAVANESYGSAMRATFVAATDTSSRVVPEHGAAARSVLVAAGSPLAPSAHSDVRTFERVPELDTPSGPDGDRLPNEVLARHGSGSGGVRSGLAWNGPEGEERIAPVGWYAYRRADGAVYWRSGESGAVALTDASILGWGWSLQRAALVDVTDCGRVHGYFVTE